MYRKIWTSLLKSINLNLKMNSKDDQKFIGILDIFGFENFKNNSLEQMCINYTNEVLSKIYSQEIYDREIDAYNEEGVGDAIDVKNLHMQGNCVEFLRTIFRKITSYSQGKWERPQLLEYLLQIQTKQDGFNVPCLFTPETYETEKLYTEKDLFSILSEKKKFWNTEEDDFRNKYSGQYISSVCATNSEKCRLFVKHYAGLVEYNLVNFFNKDSEGIKKDITEFVLSNYIRGGLLTDTVEKFFDPARQDDNFTEKDYISHNFLENMEELERTLLGTDMQFVRCIKPNDEREELRADVDELLLQLVASGILQTIAIKQTAFPGRMSFAKFLLTYSRYFPVPPPIVKPDGDQHREQCLRMLNEITSFQCLVHGNANEATHDPANCSRYWTNLHNNGTLADNLQWFGDQILDKKQQSLFLIGNKSVLLKARCERLLNRLIEHRRQDVARHLRTRCRILLNHYQIMGAARVEGRLLDAFNGNRQVAMDYKYLGTMFPHVHHNTLQDIAEKSAGNREAMETKLLNAHRKTAVGGNPQYNFLPLSMRLVLDLAKVDRPSRQNMMRRSAVTKESLVRDNKVFLQEGDALKERTGMYDTDIGKMRQLSDVNMRWDMDKVSGTNVVPLLIA